MNRPYAPAGNTVPGVYQRCTSECPEDGCKQHKWAYSIELAAAYGKPRHQVSKSGFTSGKAAKHAREELAKQHRDGKLPSDGKKTVAEWLPEWLELKAGRGEIEESTARGYADNIKNHLLPHLGHRKLGELRGLDLTRAYRAMVAERQAAIAVANERNAAYEAKAAKINAPREAKGQRLVAVTRCAVPRPLGPATIARIHACLSGALKSAVKAGMIPHSVAPDAELPKIERKKIRIPEPEQYGAFLDEVERDRLYPLLVIAGYGGLRRGELAGLRWEHVNLKTGELTVAAQRTSVGYKVTEKDTKTAAGQDRTVMLDAGTLEILKTWKATQSAEKLQWGRDWQGEGHVFTHEDGKPLHPDAVTKRVSRLARLAGLKGTLHTLRHFHGSVMLDEGVPIEIVSKRLGHANVTITSAVYAHQLARAGASASEAAAARIPRRKTA